MKPDDKQKVTPAEIAEMIKLASFFGLNYSQEQARSFIMKNLKGVNNDDKRTEKPEDVD